MNNKKKSNDSSAFASLLTQAISKDTDNQFIQKIIDLIPGLVTVYNIHTGHYMYINSYSSKLLGYSKKEFFSGGIAFVSSLVHPKDAQALMEKNKQALEKANNINAKKSDKDPIVTFEYRLKHKNGMFRWLHTTGIVFDRDEQGKVLHVMNISIDITERKEVELQAEKKALEGEERYKAFVLQSREGIWRFELKKPISIKLSPSQQIAHFFKYGYLAECNDAMARMYGYKKREEIQGAPLDTFLIKNDPANIAYLEAFIASAYHLANVESHEKDKQGNDKYFINNLVGIIKEDKLLRAWGTQQDISQQKKTSKTIQHFAAIVASSDDAIISKTLDGIITSWNKGAEKLFGWKAKEAIGKPIFIIIPSTHHAEEEKIISNIKKGKHISNYETIRKTKSGKFIHVSLSISPIKTDTGEIIGSSKIARDISQRKKFEEELQIGEERLRLALDAGKIGVWDWDIVKNDIQWSDKVYEIHGIEKNKRIGKIEEYSQDIHPLDKERVNQLIRNAIQSKNSYDAEFRIVTPNGETRWITTSAIILRNGSGKPLRMLGATTDITQRKTIEQQKDEFMGIVSHELKTPVTSLKAYVQVLQLKFAKAKDEKNVIHLTKIDSQINKLAALIEDLLDVTKIEGGKLQFHNEYFYFDELVSEIIEEVQRTTEKHTLIKEGVTKKTIYGDRERIGQVITNLLTNAIKYSPHTGKIIIKTVHTNDMVKIAVQDFGVGISKEKKPHIFERFYRETGPHDITFPGLGLGLYISSQIIQRQQGQIWVESEKGKGSTFYFTLPIYKKKDRHA